MAIHLGQEELPYVVEAVSFNDNQITIQYINPAKESRKVMIAETIMFEPAVIDRDQLDGLLRLICDLIDDAGTALHAPPERLRG